MATQSEKQLMNTGLHICGCQAKNISVNNEAENITDGANNSAVRAKRIYIYLISKASKGSIG